MVLGKSPEFGGVEYQVVHEFLRSQGYDLKKSITDRSDSEGEILHRIYVRGGGEPGPIIHFPVKGKMVSCEHYEKIKTIFEQSGGP